MKIYANHGKISDDVSYDDVSKAFGEVVDVINEIRGREGYGLLNASDKSVMDATADMYLSQANFYLDNLEKIPLKLANHMSVWLREAVVYELIKPLDKVYEKLEGVACDGMTKDMRPIQQAMMYLDLNYSNLTKHLI